jgi:hypothetical protein
MADFLDKKAGTSLLRERAGESTLLVILEVMIL